MKNKISYFVLFLASILFFSCTKKELDIPKIYFNKASSYQVVSGTYLPGTKCSVAVWCVQSENEKVKNRDFRVLKNVNDTSESVVFSKTFADKEKEQYQYLMQHVCGNQVGEVVRYTFIVTSDKGVENRISQAFTVAN